MGIVQPSLIAATHGHNYSKAQGISNGSRFCFLIRKAGLLRPTAVSCYPCGAGLAECGQCVVFGCHERIGEGNLENICSFERELVGDP